MTNNFASSRDLIIITSCVHFLLHQLELNRSYYLTKILPDFRFSQRVGGL